MGLIVGSYFHFARLATARLGVDGGSLSLFANANIETFHYFAKQNTDFLALFFYANISFATNCLLTFNIIIGRVAEELGDRIA